MSENKKGVSPLASGVAGAIIGAAAAAAAIALSDEKNKKKAQEVLAGLEKEGNKVLREITRRALEIKDMVIKPASPKQPRTKSKK